MKTTTYEESKYDKFFLEC